MSVQKCTFKKWVSKGKEEKMAKAVLCNLIIIK